MQGSGSQGAEVGVRQPSTGVGQPGAEVQVCWGTEAWRPGQCSVGAGAPSLPPGSSTLPVCTWVLSRSFSASVSLSPKSNDPTALPSSQTACGPQDQGCPPSRQHQAGARSPSQPPGRSSLRKGRGRSLLLRSQSRPAHPAQSVLKSHSAARLLEQRGLPPTSPGASGLSCTPAPSHTRPHGSLSGSAGTLSPRCHALHLWQQDRQ